MVLKRLMLCSTRELRNNVKRVSAAFTEATFLSSSYRMELMMSVVRFRSMWGDSGDEKMFVSSR